MAPRVTEAEQKFSFLSHSDELYSVTSPLSGKILESCLTDYWFSGYTVTFLVENGTLSLVKLLMEMSFFSLKQTNKSVIQCQALWHKQAEQSRTTSEVVVVSLTRRPWYMEELVIRINGQPE